MALLTVSLVALVLTVSHITGKFMSIYIMVEYHKFVNFGRNLHKIVEMTDTVYNYTEIIANNCTAQDCVRANSGGADSLPLFEDPGGRGAPRIEANPVQVIIKSYEFHCCGKVGSWAAVVYPNGGGHTDGVYSIKFQIWRPMGDNTFFKIGENSFTYSG